MVLALGVQQSDLIIHIHVSILFQILFPYVFTEYLAQYLPTVLYGRYLFVLYFKYSNVLLNPNLHFYLCFLIIT